MARRAAVATSVVCIAAACGAAFAPSQAQHPSARVVSPLTVIAAPTPRLPVPLYDTSGSIPQVTGSGIDLRNVNIALRDAVLRDQRAYAPSAAAAAKVTGRTCRGAYSVLTNRGLLSASTVVVSALMPAQKLYPCGNDGNTWISVTVRVPSGKRVALAQLFSDPEGEGLYQLGLAWFRVIARDWRLSCVFPHLPHYEPTLRNYRYFALTPRGLALAFWQEAACNRIEGIVPYRALRPYLSDLGKQLVAAVRRPQ